MEAAVASRARAGESRPISPSRTRANPETGISRLAGTTVNIQIPGHGNVLADRGTITIDFTTEPWTVLHEGGPHPLFHEGYGALCDYLAS